MACNAYTNQTAPQIIFGGTLAADFCHVDWPTTFETFRDSLTGVLPGTVSSFIVSDVEPGVNDRDKAWLRVSPSCVPIGWFLYYGGEWVQVGATVFYGVDTSAAVNTITVTATDPNVNLLSTGQIYLIKLANSNTGPMTATINTPMAVGIAVKKHGTAPLTGYETLAGMIGIFTYDGTNLQLLNPRTDAITAKEDGLFNGSFEIDFDSDAIPDRWTRTLLTTGTGVIDSTDSIHGNNSFKFTTAGGAGNGGGYIETSNFLECDGTEPVYLTWWMKSTVTIDNKVELRWFDDAQLALAGPNDVTVIYAEAANNPTTWTRMVGLGIAPAAARYFKIRVHGGLLNSAVGTVRYDDFRIGEPIFKRAAVFGVPGQLYQWKCPPGPGGITSVCGARISAIGSGAGGIVTGAAGGGGGGGGSFSQSLLYLTPGTVYQVIVAGGGAAGVAGNNSSFGATLVVAIGGSVGLLATGGVAGTGGTGMILFSGVNGSNGAGGSVGGAGGESGSAAAGGRGGLSGVSVSDDGQDGLSPGAGGGGSGGTVVAGTGGDGLVSIEIF